MQGVWSSPTQQRYFLQTEASNLLAEAGVHPGRGGVSRTEVARVQEDKMCARYVQLAVSSEHGQLIGKYHAVYHQPLGHGLHVPGGGLYREISS